MSIEAYSANEVREGLELPADCHCECDGCHAEAPCWVDLREPGEWAYCEKCWTKIAWKLERRAAQRITARGFRDFEYLD